jgi:hypothetical protein
MPWVRKYPHSTRGNWIIGIVAGVFFGLLLGYERWGSTAAVVAIVEKELSATESHITDLENRVIQLEARVVSQESNPVVMEGKGVDGKTANDLTRASSKGASDTVRRRADAY